MGDESAMSAMSGMSGMESSQSQGPTGGDAPAGGGGSKGIIIAGILLCLVGVGVGAFLLLGQGKGADDDDEKTENPSQGSSNPSNPSIENPPPPGDPITPAKPEGPTPKPRPQEVPKDFVMCTVGIHFKEPEKYKDVPCDYIVYDNMIGTSKGVIPTQDFKAWKNFLKLASMVSWQMPGVSFMGWFFKNMSSVWSTAETKKNLTALANSGIVAFGISNVPVPSDKSKVAGIVSDITNFFNVLADVKATLGTKGELFTTFCTVKINATSAPNLDEFVKKFAGSLVVVLTHNGIWPASGSNCTYSPTSSWNQKGNNLAAAESALKGMSPQIPVGVSFTMGVLVHAYDGTISPTALPTGACKYMSMVRYEDWCPLRGQEKYDDKNMTVTNVADQIVATYNSKKSLEDSIKKLKQTVTYPFGVMLHDIQFDNIAVDDCQQDETLGRVKYVNGIMHSSSTP